MIISQYLLESSFCLLLFYGFYHFMLKKETFFQLNRVYLLVTPALSLIIPFLEISLQSGQVTEDFGYFFPILTQADEMQIMLGQTLSEPTPAFTLSLGELLLAAYLLGGLLMFLKLINGLWNIFSMIQNNKKAKSAEGTFVNTEMNFPASSFFSFIFWNHGKTSDNQQLIIEHEKVHIRQWHSLDVLMIELIIVLKWFNPLIYWFRNALRETHEYIADAYILKKIAPIKEYATALVEEAKSQQNRKQNLLSHTFHSLMKKRLYMMMQQKSKNSKSWKYLLTLPLILVLMLLFSFNLVEQIPGSEKLNQLSQYLEDLGETTVFEMDNEEKQPSFLIWGNQRYSLLTNNDLYKISDANNSTISLENLEQLIEELPMITYQGLDIPIEEKVVIYQSGDCISTCKVVSGKSHFCFNKLKGTVPNNSVLGLIFKLKNGVICRTDFTIGEIPENGNNSNFANALGRNLEEMTKINLTVTDIKGEYQLLWDDFVFEIKKNPSSYEARFMGAGKAKMTLADFQKLGEKIPLFKAAENTAELGGLQFIRASRPPMGIVPPELRDWFSKKSFDQFRMINNYLNYEDLEEILGYIERGYPVLEFEFNTATNIDGIQKGTLKIEIVNENGDWFPDIALNNPDASEGVFGFQLINRRGQKTVIKMDTTNQKYRWMYEEYRDGKELDIIHIPNFQTVRRVITFDDALLPLNEIGRTTNLCEKESNALLYPEFYDFEDVRVNLMWRDVWGVQDETVYDLDNFLKSKKIEPELHLHDKKYEILQYEIWVKPIMGQASHFITNTMQHPEIEPVINALDSRTSVYFSNFLIKDEAGKEVLFPMSFVFNLMDNPINIAPRTSSLIDEYTNVIDLSNPNIKYQLYLGDYQILLPKTKERAYREVVKSYMPYQDFMEKIKEIPQLGVNSDVLFNYVQFDLIHIRKGEKIATCQVVADRNNPGTYTYDGCLQNILKTIEKDDVVFFRNIVSNVHEEGIMYDLDIYLTDKKASPKKEHLYFEITQGDASNSAKKEVTSNHYYYKNYKLSTLLKTTLADLYQDYEFVGLEEDPVITVKFSYPNWRVYSDNTINKLIYYELRDQFEFKPEYSEDFPKTLTIIFDEAIKLMELKKKDKQTPPIETIVNIDIKEGIKEIAPLHQSIGTEAIRFHNYPLSTLIEKLLEKKYQDIELLEFDEEEILSIEITANTGLYSNNQTTSAALHNILFEQLQKRYILSIQKITDDKGESNKVSIVYNGKAE